ncbi:MAG: hypothetical protein UHS47_10090 [Oscillospiraceae bacterium]|nr:hypothetical protein [Oscillospiraceae bacterium]
MDGVFMCRLVRRIWICILLLGLLWTGTVIADLVQLGENKDEEKIQGMKQQFCDVVDEYGVKVKNMVIDGLIFVDQAIDKILEAVNTDGELENIFSEG